jgi:ribosome-associated toxin RatA of RatAB toxin-antitoxin module
MKTIEKSVLIWYSPAEMYKLVTAVADYPEFLPWCDHADVLAATPDGMTAEIGIAFAGVRQTFTTENTHVEGRTVGMRLVKGPFSKLDGQWQFSPLGDGSQRACKVALILTYGFDNAAMDMVVGPVFDTIAASLVDAFVKRAEQVYAAP